MKLLIIDDMAEMIVLAQEQFQKLNQTFNKNNVYFFQKRENDLAIKKFSDYSSNEDIVNCSFEGFNEEYVCNIIKAFIQDTDSTEQIFVIIDVCLKTEYTGAFTIEDYEDSQEISAQIYRWLNCVRQELKRGWNLQFLIYSRSEIFVDVISNVLNNTHDSKYEPDFSRIDCMPENISWAFNLWRPQQQIKEKNATYKYPIFLNDNVVEYFQSLSE